MLCADSYLNQSIEERTSDTLVTELPKTSEDKKLEEYTFSFELL